MANPQCVPTAFWSHLTAIKFLACVWRRVNGLHLEGVCYSHLITRPLEVRVTVLDHHNTGVSETRLRATASLRKQIYLTVPVTFLKIAPG